MVSPARLIILGTENAWQVNLLLEMFNVGGGVMLAVEVSAITSQQQKSDDRNSPALELHAIAAVD